MGDKLFDFHVQMRIHELHDIFSEDLAKMIEIGLKVMKNDTNVPKNIALTKGVNRIESAGRGWSKWVNPDFVVVIEP